MATEFSQVNIRHIRRRLLAWYDRHKRDLPWRGTRDPYAIWLSEIMLQQTQVATALPYYERFLKRFPTVRSLAAAKLDEVLRMWAGLGYYARARNMHRAAKKVVAEFGGRFPSSVEELRSLPGIGRYSAAAIASIAYGTRSAVVDGNVARVVARLADIRHDVRRGAGNKKAWDFAEALMPSKRCGDFNQAMMEFGARVCLPRGAAHCEVCPLRSGCKALAAGTVARRPVKAARVVVTKERHVVAAIERDGRWLVVRRPDDGLWGGLWELPTAVLNGEAPPQAAMILATNILGARCRASPKGFCDVTRQLSHRSIQFLGHRCRATARSSLRRGRSGNSRWLTIAQMASLPMSRAMRDVVETLTTARRPASAGAGASAANSP
ncbi:MAG TPA: A/G-specific adenine glycosylase [Phycisphaerae bacterium]|nr:A/G-specific adenine glycosylase [Phycisphaerae bacterium]